MDAIDQIRILPSLPGEAGALDCLSRPVRSWFQSTYTAPTAAQRGCWPAIAAGQNVLVSAPTGGGKTLAAFLPIIDRLLQDDSPAGMHCLYVAPQKALVADAKRNLRRCLYALREHDGARRILVAMRSGDSSARTRRRLRTAPPTLLLTTPESLAILLAQPVGAKLLSGVRWVIVDEVHSLAPNKRGADLALSLERLEALAGRPLVRIGLSATCHPVAEAARFLVGAQRACAVVAVADHAPVDLRIEPMAEGFGFISRLIERLSVELAERRTTLIFAGARGLAERIGWALSNRHPRWAIGVHHASLDRTRRRLVERRMKSGRLRAIVCSTSLELGIDIGAIEQVVLIHPPRDVIRLLQRIGRSGHGPGLPRRGLVLTTGAAELLEATVTAACGKLRECEPLETVNAPLDVLCQQLIGMAMRGSMSADEAFQVARRAHPYRDLARVDFDDCLRYLLGRSSDGSDWLPPRLIEESGRLRVSDTGTAKRLLRSLGTILSEDSRTVRLVADNPDKTAAGRTTIGELDLAYADRLRPGDRFLLDNRCLEVRRAEWDVVLVAERVGRPMVPKWKGDGGPLSRELARRLYLLRMRAAEALRESPQALWRLLRTDYDLDAAAAKSLVEFFERQERISEIPEPGVCLIEIMIGSGGIRSFVHTPLNRAGNDALARVVARRWLLASGRTVTSIIADLGFMLCSEAGPPEGDSWRSLFAAASFDRDLGLAIDNSFTLRERFHKAATIGLMLPRHPPGGGRKVGGRTWAERRLFDRVRRDDPEFVLLRQARREVCQEVCDAEAAQAFLTELGGWRLHCRRLTQISPFVEGWSQLSAGPVESSANPGEALVRLHESLMRGADARPCRLAVNA